MKAETYRRKAEKLREKASNMNPRFWRKIEELEAEADRLEERAAEKEAEEAESEEDEDSWDEEDDTIGWCDDDDGDDDDDDDDDDELPQISPSYHGWSISVEKDKEHKYVVTAVPDDRYNHDSIKIYGDQIDDDIETVIENEIDYSNEKRAEAEDFIKNHRKYMNLDEDPDFDDSNDPD